MLHYTTSLNTLFFLKYTRRLKDVFFWGNFNLNLKTVFPGGSKTDWWVARPDHLDPPNDHCNNTEMFEAPFRAVCLSHIKQDRAGILFLPEYNVTLCATSRMLTSLYSVCITVKYFFSGGSKGGREGRPPGSKSFQFHAVFGKIWLNHMLAPNGELAPLLREILDPPLFLLPVNKVVRRYL